jgi:hypothetical protein
MSNQIEMKRRLKTVAEELEKGSTTEEILAIYMNEWKAGERTVERYIALARDIVLERIDKEDAIIDALRGNAIAEQLESMRSTLELEAILVKVAEGGYVSEKVTKGENSTTVTASKPLASDVVRAATTLLKRKDVKRTRKSSPDMTIKGPTLIVKTEEQRRLIEKTRDME